jgi:signal transduction histidine kinase
MAATKTKNLETEGAPLALPTAADLSLGFAAFQGASERLVSSYQALEARAAALEREVVRLDALAGLAELALGIAHEIRNPLNAVAGFAGLLRRTKDPERLADWATRIEAGVAQIDEIVRRLLSFGQPTGGLRTATTASQVVKAALRDCDPAPRHVVIRGPTRDRRLRTDPIALRQVLLNLLRNAVEAGGPRVPIRVEIGGTTDALRLEVIDGGPGIDAAVRGRLFDPFVSSKPGGSGLGLSLCHRIARALGGRIELADDTPGRTCFCIELPWDVPEADRAV